MQASLQNFSRCAIISTEGKEKIFDNKKKKQFGKILFNLGNF